MGNLTISLFSASSRKLYLFVMFCDGLKCFYILHGTVLDKKNSKLVISGREIKYTNDSQELVSISINKIIDKFKTLLRRHL
jgi:hypothetical protein